MALLEQLMAADHALSQHPESREALEVGWGGGGGVGAAGSGTTCVSIQGAASQSAGCCRSFVDVTASCVRPNHRSCSTGRGEGGVTSPASQGGYKNGDV
jgi:hypothetical protein